MSNMMESFSPHDLALTERLIDSGLTDAQRNFLRARTAPHHLFAVVSWGCAATTWLARALNSHHDIFCAHCLGNALMNLGGAPSISGLAYLRILAGQGGYKAVGDVHGVARHEIKPLRAALGDEFGCAILVREPLARLRSQFSLFRRCGYQGWGNLDYVDSISETAGLDPKSLSVEQRHALHGINMLNAIIDERATDARIFRIEDVTSSPRPFTDLVLEITGGKVDCDPAWAELVIGMTPTNRHISYASAEIDNWTITMLGRVVKKEAWDHWCPVDGKERSGKV